MVPLAHLMCILNSRQLRTKPAIQVEYSLEVQEHKQCRRRLHSGTFHVFRPALTLSGRLIQLDVDLFPPFQSPNYARIVKEKVANAL